MSPLDAALAAMNADPENASPRLAFMARLAEAELYLLLEAEPEDEKIKPTIFDTDDGRFILMFDTEARLANFAGEAPYAALSGRAMASMIDGQGIGIALNLDTPDTAFLLPADGVQWLARTTQGAPEETSAKITELSAPAGLPDALLVALDATLATVAGRADAAWLAAVEYEGGARGHLLVFTDPAPGAEGALAAAVREALVFSGLEAGVLDVTFAPSASGLAARLVRHALRIDLPKPPSAPAPDPDTPPRLR